MQNEGVPPSAPLTGYNTFVPIEQLPVELLVEIFHYIVPPRSEDGFEWSSNWSYLENILSVCRTWREVVNDTPALWTHVYPIGIPEPVLRQRLRRSGTSKLDVLIEYDQTKPMHWKTLKTHVRRFRYLRLWDRFPFVTDIEHSFDIFQFLAPAASLETLEIWGDEIISNVFRGRLPILPRLHVFDCGKCTRWPIIWHFTELTTLKIDARLVWTDDSNFLQKVLDTLRVNPRLRNIDLCLPDTFLAPSHVVCPQLSFQSLEWLTLQSGQLGIQEILSHLALPAFTRVALFVNLVDGNIPDPTDWPTSPLSLVLPADTSSLTFFDTVTQLDASCNHTEDSTITLEFLAQGSSVMILTFNLVSLLVKGFELLGLVRWVLSDLTGLPLPRLLEVTISGENLAQYEIWDDFLKSLPFVRALRICCSVGSVLNALCFPEGVNEPDACPQLQDLTIDLGAVEDANYVGELLYEVAQERIEASCPIPWIAGNLPENRELLSDDMLPYFGVCSLSQPAEPDIISLQGLHYDIDITTCTDTPTIVAIWPQAHEA